MEDIISHRELLHLTFEQANLICKSHLGLECAKMVEVEDFGFNNRVYFITSSDGNQFVLRLSGKAWKKFKTENEVAALNFIQKNTTIPAPKVLWYDTTGEEIGNEYIAMEKMEGIQLSKIWPKLSLDNKKLVVQQLAKVVGQMKKFTFNQIGGFEMKGDEIVIGRGSEGGPFDDYRTYLETKLENQILKLKGNPIFQGFAKYAEDVKEIFETQFQIGDILKEPRICFFHGDLSERNILVNESSLTITAVLDWEWSGAYLQDEEWFESFEFTKDEEENDREVLKALLWAEVKKCNVSTPADIPHFALRDSLYEILDSLAPWYLPVLREDQPERVQQRINEGIENLSKNLQLYYSKYVTKT